MKRFLGDVTTLPTWLDKWTGRPIQFHCLQCSRDAGVTTYAEQYVFSDVALYCKACGHEYVEQGTAWGHNDPNLYGEIDEIKALQGK